MTDKEHRRARSGSDGEKTAKKKKSAAKRRSRPVWPAILLALLLIAAGAYFIFLAPEGGSEELSAAPHAPVPTPTRTETAAEPTPEPPPEPTPEPAAEPTPEPAPEPTPDMSPLPPEFFDDAVFVGDSITNELKVYTYTHDELGAPQFITQDSCSVRNLAEYGTLISYKGKKTSLPDAIADCGAKRVFIMLGINDIGVISIDRAMEDWGKFVGMIREKSPDIEIYIQSCTPMYGTSQNGKMTNARIDEYNARLKDFAAENGCCYVEIGAYFKDENGNLISSLTQDYYVHFKQTGCKIWAEALIDPANYTDLKR